MKAIDGAGNEIQLARGTIVFPANLPYAIDNLKKRVLSSREIYIISLNQGSHHGSGDCLRVAEKVTVASHQDTIVQQVTNAYAVFFPGE